MAGIPFNRVRHLVTAYADRNDEMFKRAVAQIAAGLPKDKGTELLAKTSRFKALEMLPREALELVFEAPKSDVSLALPEEITEQLSCVKHEWRARDHLTNAGLKPASRLLFWGPPGNGKPTCAAQLARDIGLTPFVCDMGSIVESHMGATSAKLQKVFGVLQAGQALIFDEIDAIGQMRGQTSSAGDKENNRIVSTLLTMLDKEPGGILIATTNRLDMLDTALLRRFDETLIFPSPPSEQLYEFARQLSASYGIKTAPWTHSPDGITNYDAATKWVKKLAKKRICETLDSAGRMNGQTLLLKGAPV